MAWAAAAAIVIVVAAVVYLRPSAPAPFPAAAPTVKPGEATTGFVLYDFPSPTVGWALGFPDQTFRTSDGGANWKSLSLPDTRPSYMNFRDDRHGWLMVIDARQHALVYSTDDSGDTWRALSDIPADANFFAFRRTSEAWIASGGPESPHVYRSIDGGLSWQRREIPFPDGDVTMKTIGSWSTFLRLLPGEGVIASTFCTCPANAFFESASFDGGATWRFLPDAPFRGASARQPVVAYQDDIHWWYVDAGTLYRSSDSGRTWTKASTQLPDWEFMPRAIDGFGSRAVAGSITFGSPNVSPARNCSRVKSISSPEGKRFQ